MNKFEMQVVIVILIILFETFLALSIIFYNKYKAAKLDAQRQYEIRENVRRRNDKLRGYRSEKIRFEKALTDLVLANDNLFLNIDGKGDLADALVKAKLILKGENND